MNKRTLDAVGWTLLFPAMIFAPSGIPGVGFGVSTTIVIVLAVASIPLFHLGADDHRRCHRSARAE